MEFIKRHLNIWILLALSLVFVSWFAPQQLPVLVFKNLQIFNGVILAYLVDRTLFRHTLPVDNTLEYSTLGPARLVARALIVLAILVALALGI